MSKLIIYIAGIVSGIVFASSYPDIAVKINEGMSWLLVPLFDLLKEKLGSVLT